MAKYTYNPPYNQWSGNRSDTLNKWKINYKGSIATASALPSKGEFKGDTYNVLEDGSNYMWNGNSWDKLDANTYIGATSETNGIRGLVPPASSSERNKFLKGDGTYKDVAWDMIVGKPVTFTPSTHTHDWDDIINEPTFALDNNVVHLTNDEIINGIKYFYGLNWISSNMEVENTTSDQWYVSAFLDKNSHSLVNYSLHKTTSERSWSLRLFDANKSQHWFLFCNLSHDGSSSDIGIGCDCYPYNNNSATCGKSDRKWKEIWCTQSSLNSSSDERLKSEISSIPDKVLDAWNDINWIQFKYKDALQEKGDNARLHNGLIAQEVDRLFKSKNLDISKYGLFLYDEWEATLEEKDQKGNIIKEAKPASNEYGLRYTEVLCMEAAYQRRENARLKRRIASLEARIEALEAKLV